MTAGHIAPAANFPSLPCKLCPTTPIMWWAKRCVRNYTRQKSAHREGQIIALIKSTRLGSPWQTADKCWKECAIISQNGRNPRHVRESQICGVAREKKKGGRVGANWTIWSNWRWVADGADACTIGNNNISFSRPLRNFCSSNSWRCGMWRCEVKTDVVIVWFSWFCVSILRDLLLWGTGSVRVGRCCCF